MYVPQQGVDIFAGNGAVPEPAGLGAMTPAPASPEGGFPVGQALRLGRTGLNLAMKAFPETMQPVSNLIPSWGEIGSALGLDGLFSGIGSTGLGAAGLGALTAAGYTMPALGAFMAMRALAPPDDTSVLLGAGRGDMQGYEDRFGQSQRGLYDQFMGDRGWAEGGDASRVSPLDFSYGSMSMRQPMPYHAIGRVPYRTPELAVNAGRSIARGQMGLPVTHEAIPTDAAGIGSMLRGGTVPVWDAPEQMPEEWNAMRDRYLNLGTGEGQSSADVGVDAFRAGLSDRARQFFDTGMKQDDFWAYTSPSMADDDVFEPETIRNDTLSRVAGWAGLDNAQPFDPFTHAMGGGGHRFFGPNWGRGEQT